MRTLELQSTSPQEQGDHKNYYQEIEAMREPIENLLEQLREKIDRGEYSLLIGDDVSARIPTLIFRKIFKELYKGLNEKTPETLFVAGSGHDNAEISGEKLDNKKRAIREFLLKHSPEKRILILTEYIRTGSTLRPLIASLRDLGLDYDIATLSIKSVQDLSKFQKDFNCDVFGGVEGAGAAEFMRHTGNLKDIEGNGVTKKTENLHSETIDADSRKRKKLRNFREDANGLARELVDWYRTE